MDISVNILDLKSLENAIKKLKKYKESYEEMKTELLRRSCNWVRARALSHLGASGISPFVARDIDDSANIIVDKGVARLVYGDKAVWVEFGVGIEGKGTYKGEVDPRYEYNKESDYKLIDGGWVFETDIEYLDMPQDAIVSSMRKSSGHTKILTRGTKGAMFLYNSIVDYMAQNIAEKLWKEILKEYIK